MSSLTAGTPSVYIRPKLLASASCGSFLLPAVSPTRSCTCRSRLSEPMEDSLTRSSKDDAAAHILDSPRAVPPPMQVPETLVNRPGPSTLSMETPEPMLTSRNGD